MKKFTKNTIWFAGLFLMPLANYAQESGMVDSKSYFSNALFITLLIVIIGLLLVIIGLTSALKNISQSEYVQTKFKKAEETKNNSSITKTLTLLFLLFAGYSTVAQNNSNAPNNDWLIGGLDMFTIYFMFEVIIVELIFILVIYNLMMGILRTEKVTSSVVKPKTKNILEKINASVDIEKEADIMLDHNYDGIVELDNNLPPWWKYGFYLTIVIGIIYLINYHVTGTGDLQTAGY